MHLYTQMPSYSKQSHVIAHITDNTVAGSVQGLEHAARREAADLFFFLFLKREAICLMMYRLGL